LKFITLSAGERVLKIGEDLTNLEAKERPVHSFWTTHADRCSRASGGTDYWIGLYKSAPVATDNCYWLDGNPSTYRNWVGTEPNSADLCIRMSAGGVYRDIACNNPYGYVCKTDKGNLAVFN